MLISFSIIMPKVLHPSIKTKIIVIRKLKKTQVFYWYDALPNFPSDRDKNTILYMAIQEFRYLYGFVQWLIL